MTDIAQIKPHNRRVPLLHPGTLEELGLAFFLKSPHHPDVKAAEREWQNARLKKRNLDITVEAFEAARVKVLTAHVEGWEWDPETDTTLNGERPDFSRGACMKLIRENDWIREFLDQETGNATRFYEGSETS